MHPECFNLFANLSGRLAGYGKILEVGSFNVNGSIRPLFSAYSYVGCDQSEGPGVDVVQSAPHKLPFGDEEFDVVLSASCLEHCKRPWELVLEMDRVLKGNGILAITVPWGIGYHAYPIDCWRITPDAFDELLGPWMVEHGRSPYRILQNRFDFLDTYLEAVKPQ